MKRKQEEPSTSKAAPLLGASIAAAHREYCYPYETSGRFKQLSTPPPELRWRQALKCKHAFAAVAKGARTKFRAAAQVTVTQSSTAL